MPANDPTLIINVPGYVTFKGVNLGPVKAMQFRSNYREVGLKMEEYGNQVGEFFNVATFPIFTCILRSFSTSVLAMVMPGKNVLSGTGQAGSSLSSLSGELRFVPDSSSHPGLVLYEASPIPEDIGVTPFGWNEEFAIQLVFTGLPDSSGKTWDYT